MNPKTLILFLTLASCGAEPAGIVPGDVDEVPGDVDLEPPPIAVQAVEVTADGEVLGWLLGLPTPYHADVIDELGRRFVVNLSTGAIVGGQTLHYGAPGCDGPAFLRDPEEYGDACRQGSPEQQAFRWVVGVGSGAYGWTPATSTLEVTGTEEILPLSRRLPSGLCEEIPSFPDPIAVCASRLVEGALPGVLAMPVELRTP